MTKQAKILTDAQIKAALATVPRQLLHVPNRPARRRDKSLGVTQRYIEGNSEAKRRVVGMI